LIKSVANKQHIEKQGSNNGEEIVAQNDLLFKKQRDAGSLCEARVVGVRLFSFLVAKY
jgi:hypothetical protein